MEIKTTDSLRKSRPVALVTGAARRIGAAIVRRLHEDGYQVVIHCHHSMDDAHVLADELNAGRADSARILQADLTHQPAVIDGMAQVMQWKGRLDVLVNNASVFIRTPLPGFYNAETETMWLTNVNAPFWLSEAAYPFLAEQEGCIINITDIHASMPLKDYSVYCQTKAALKMQTEALSREYAPLVRVNAVAPGAIAWPEGKNTLSQQQQQSILSKTPLKRHGDPRWIAHAVAFFAENKFITGQTLCVDGGRSL
jgi:pteridine reductase